MRSRLGEWFWQWRMKLAGHPLTEPGCGRCGYPVRGLTSTRCPECGAEQSEVGVSHPMFPLVGRKHIYRLHLLTWTLVLVPAAILLNPLLLPLTPRGISNHRDYLVESSSLPALNIRHIGYGWGWLLPLWIPDAPMTVWITPHVSEQALLARYSAELSQAYGTVGYVFRWRNTGDGRSDRIFEEREPFGREIVSRWLAAMEIDTSTPAAIAEIDELVRLAALRPFNAPIPATHAIRITSVTGGPAIEPALEGQRWVIAFWILVWLIGLFIIRRRHRGVLPPGALGGAETMRR